MEPEDVLERIRNVDIQGATSIAREGVLLMKEMEEEGAGTERLREVAGELMEVRPVEPFLRNCLNSGLEHSDFERVLEHIETSQERIVDNGLPLVEENDVIYTHCHSSTVSGLLEEASDMDIEVRITETRPLFQGRKTAEALSGSGIDVKFYVDSAAKIALEGADKMLIGADAIAPGGEVLNKVGSGMFSEIARSMEVPVYVITDSWKFDPGLSFGHGRGMDRREGSEVWEDAPGKVDIFNYAFESVPPGMITDVISEIGIHSPSDFVNTVQEEYGFLSV